jgi:hypothetical protein
MRIGLPIRLLRGAGCRSAAYNEETGTAAYYRSRLHGGAQQVVLDFLLTL